MVPVVLQHAAQIGRTHNPIFGTIIEAGDAGPANATIIPGPRSTSWINDGTPTSIAVRAFNTLAAPLKWSNIGSRIDFGPLLGASGSISAQVYPTYYIFENRRLVRTIQQAPTPIQNFSTNPYPPGPAPFVIQR
jgi:hypothetical protein